MEKAETKNIRIISSPSAENPFIVLYKPHGLPSAPLSESDTTNALFQAQELFPEINAVQGRKEIEKGLLHRLDTVTAGLLMIATTQRCYDKMIEEQNNGDFQKYYKAKCEVFRKNAYFFEGFPRFWAKTEPLFAQNEEIKISSYFRPFGSGNKEVRPVTEESGKAALKKIKNPVNYETLVKIASIEKTGFCEVLCKIARGYRHQVRCHLAWIGLPVLNDALYNHNAAHLENNNNMGEIQFEASALEFFHPITLEKTFIET